MLGYVIRFGLRLCRRSSFLFCALFLALAMFLYGMYFALYNSPIDQLQKDAVRIMYVHVPCAWLGILMYSVMAFTSCMYLILRSSVFSFVSIAIAPIGACFTFLCIVTGMIWGYPIWGAWWVWDARLTFMLILLLFYLGYIVLSNATLSARRLHFTLSVFSIVGLINIPLIKYSVVLLRTLHQPASIKSYNKATIDINMLKPLLIMFISMCIIAFVLSLMRMNIVMCRNRLNNYD